MTKIAVYRRRKPTPHPQNFLSSWQNGGIAIIISASHESLQNLQELVGAEGRAWLLQMPLIVMSERGRALAQQCGFTREIIVPTQPTDEALVEALKKYAGAPAEEFNKHQR